VLKEIATCLLSGTARDCSADRNGDTVIGDEGDEAPMIGGALDGVA
jgi:hypothetical protein